jgi:sulfide:quinone oxidoreductase
MQGASCFGPAYEYAMVLDHELRSKGLRDKSPITFVTSEPYVGHMGLAGVGDSYKLLVQMLAERDITVLTNCEVNKVDQKAGVVKVTQSILPLGEAEAHARAGEDTFPWKASTGKQTAEIPASFVMMIPQFKGQDCWKRSSKGLADEKGLIHVDEFMRNPSYPDVFGVGVCVKFPPVEKTPIATGAPKTGYLIESMGTAVAMNIREMILAKRADKELNESKLKRPSLDTLCLTDFGGSDGALFLASPEMPPRRHTETVVGGIVKLAKVAFEKYFLFKIRTGNADPFYEKFMLKLVGIERLEHK